MGYRTERQKRMDAIFGWFIAIALVIGICWGGHKWFGWGDNLLVKPNDSISVVDSTGIVHDTIMVQSVAYKDSIQLEYKNGHHYLTVVVDGIKMKGLMDSGCSFGISGCVADYAFLKRHGYVKDLGMCEAVIGNGDTINNTMCEVYNVRVANIVIDTLVCGFNESQDSELLIGQGVLKKFGTYVIDYNNNKLYLR